MLADRGYESAVLLNHLDGLEPEVFVVGYWHGSGFQGRGVCSPTPVGTGQPQRLVRFCRVFSRKKALRHLRVCLGMLNTDITTGFAGGRSKAVPHAKAQRSQRKGDLKSLRLCFGK